MAASSAKSAKSANPARDGIAVRWARSTIGHTAAARGTIRALGLRRMNQTVHVADTPANRGMIRRVAFLLEVTEPSSASEAGSKTEEPNS